MLLGADSRRLECSVGKVESDILQIMSLMCGQQRRMPGPSRGGSPVLAAGKLRSLHVLQVFVKRRRLCIENWSAFSFDEAQRVQDQVSHYYPLEIK